MIMQKTFGDSNDNFKSENNNKGDFRSEIMLPRT